MHIKPNQQAIPDTWMQKWIAISILYNTYLHLRHVKKNKFNPKAKIMHIQMKGPSSYIDLPYELPNSLPREASKLGWVIEFAKIVWADSLHFPYLLLPPITEILASFQPIFWPSSGSRRLPLRLCLLWRSRPAISLPVSPTWLLRRLQGTLQT